MAKLVSTITGKEVKVGDKVTLDKKKVVITNFYAKPAPSSGRVEVKNGFGAFGTQGFYPSVFNLAIVADNQTGWVCTDCDCQMGFNEKDKSSGGCHQCGGFELEPLF